MLSKEVGNFAQLFNSLITGLLKNLTMKIKLTFALCIFFPASEM